MSRKNRVTQRKLTHSVLVQRERQILAEQRGRQRRQQRRGGERQQRHDAQQGDERAEHDTITQTAAAANTAIDAADAAAAAAAADGGNGSTDSFVQMRDVDALAAAAADNDECEHGDAATSDADDGPERMTDVEAAARDLMRQRWRRRRRQRNGAAGAGHVAKTRRFRSKKDERRTRKIAVRCAQAGDGRARRTAAMRDD